MHLLHLLPSKHTANHHRLHHALLADGIRQFLQGGRVHVAPGLVPAALDQINGNFAELTVVVFQLLVKIDLGARQQGAQSTFTQTSFLRRHGVSHSSR